MLHSDRNSRADNLKAVLIFLVVFGHLIETHITGNYFLRSIWIFIYTFHMPMFAFMSGMFSKPLLDEKNSTQLVKNILVPLLTFELFYELVEYVLIGKISTYSGLVAPYWMLWYLLSLLSWRLLLPLFSRLNFGIFIAIGVSMLAAYSDASGYFLSSARTLSFFPFFLFGWKYGERALYQDHQIHQDHQAYLTSRTNRVLSTVSSVIVLAALIACFYVPAGFDYRWLYGSYSLKNLGMANLTGSLYQLLQYASSAVIGLAVLRVLTYKDLGLARIGQRSMYVFLWHGLALIFLHLSGLLERIFSLNTALATVISVLCSLLIVVLGASNWSQRFTESCMLLPLRWLLLGWRQTSGQTPSR